MDKPYAIVIGIDCMTGLQSARTFKRHGIPVIGIAQNAAHPCCRTRACARVIQTDLAGDALIDCLELLAGELNQRAVLFPCTDLAVLNVSRRRERIPAAFKVVMPSHQTVAALLDKIGFFELATAHGFPVPRGAVVRHRADAIAVCQSLRFPCVVKPSLKTVAWERHSKAKVYKVRNAEELASTVDLCLAWTDRLLVQEWIQGPDENCYTCNCYLTGNGKAVASFVSRKMRQWPTQTGIGCLSVECRDDVVRDETVRLFETVGFHGLGYAEFKVDERTGEHLIIEPNVARPTGRSAMAEAGGVELLLAMYRDALGEPLPDRLEQTYRGVKWIHLRQDVRAAWTYWRKGQLSLNQWRESWSGSKIYAIFSWSDPGPFFGDLLKVARRATSRLARRKQQPVTRTA